MVFKIFKLPVFFSKKKSLIYEKIWQIKAVIKMVLKHFKMGV